MHEALDECANELEKPTVTMFTNRIRSFQTFWERQKKQPMEKSINRLWMFEYTHSSRVALKRKINFVLFDYKR